MMDVDPEHIQSGKCQTDIRWDDWSTGFENEVATMMGTLEVLLDCAIRQPAPAGFVHPAEAEERKCQLLHAGEECEADNKVMWGMLKAAALGTSAWPWIERHDTTQNGCQAWLDLTRHHNGEGELSKRIKKAKVELKISRHKSETALPFELVITKMKQCHDILAKDEALAKSLKEQVNELFQKTHITNPVLSSVKTQMTTMFPENFEGTCNYFAGSLPKVHGAAQVQCDTQMQRKQQISEATRAGRRRHHEFHGRG